MSLLSLLGWSTRRYECCEEAHDALRMANAVIVVLTDRIGALDDELDRARDVAGTFLCCDGIDHGELS